MAWRSSGVSNVELVENLWRNGLVTDPRAKEAFLKVKPNLVASPDVLLSFPLLREFLILNRGYTKFRERDKKKKSTNT